MPIRPVCFMIMPYGVKDTGAKTGDCHHASLS